MDTASGVCLDGRGKHFLSRNVAIGQEVERAVRKGGKAVRKAGRKAKGFYTRKMGMRISWTAVFVPAFC